MLNLMTFLVLAVTAVHQGNLDGARIGTSYCKLFIEVYTDNTCATKVAPELTTTTGEQTFPSVNAFIQTAGQSLC